MIFTRDKKLNELILGEKNHLIKVITGIRRCGKSFLLNNLFNKYLLKKGVKSKQIIKFSFDNEEDIEKLEKYFPKEKTKIQIKGNRQQFVINSKKFRAYIKDMTKSRCFYYLLLDEVQLLENFVGTLISFLNITNYDVYVTGSNSKFLSSDIATEFRGRSDEIKMFPLTYKEIYEELKIDKNELLENYLMYGGLPLCVLENNIEKKERYLINSFETIYLKDILEKSKIKKELELKELTELLASSIGCLTSIKKICDTFKTKNGNSIKIETIDRYIKCLKNAFILNEAKRFDVKGRKYIGSPSKYYFFDLGLRNSILSYRQYEKTHLMENLIYNELLFRGYNVDVGEVSKFELNKTNTYSKKNFEVDFVANKGSKRYYIQSVYSIDDGNKLEKEEKSFDYIRDSFTKIIITFESHKIYRNEKGYLVIGLIDFLLDDDLIDREIAK